MGETPASPAEWLKSPFLWLAIASGGLACFLYYPLFFPPTHVNLALQSEEFFFEANESAGTPVLVLSAWLFYRQSHYADLLLGRGEPLFALVVLSLTVGLFGWGHFTGAPDLQLASLMGLLFGLVLCLGGRGAARAYAIPILFLAFALPLPPVLLSSSIFPIQLLTSEYAGAILNLIGVKSLVQGDQILRPENSFIVIETCSGVRTIVTLTMLTVLMIDLFERKGWHAALLFVAAPFLAFITNGFRVVTLVLNPHSSIHSIHNLQGIAMLLVGLLLIYVLDVLLERVLGVPDVAEGAADSVARAAGDDSGVDSGIDSGIYGAIRETSASEHAAMARSRAPRMALVLVALASMLIAGRALTPYEPPGGLSEMPDAVLTRVFTDARSKVIPPDFQFRGTLRYLAHANRHTLFAGEPLEVFLGVANEPIRQHTLLSERLAWPSSGWVPVEESFVDLGEGAQQVRRMLLKRGGRSIVSYSGYPRSRGLLIENWRQAAALDRSPFIRDEHMLAVRLSTGFGRGAGTLDEADQRMRDAWKKLSSALDGYAPVRVVTGEL